MLTKGRKSGINNEVGSVSRRIETLRVIIKSDEIAIKFNVS